MDEKTPLCVPKNNGSEIISPICELQDHLYNSTLDQLYLNGIERLEILVICGINNVKEGQSPNEIKEEILKLKEAITKHSELCEHSPANVVSFSTVNLPPKLCSLDVSPSQLNWVPVA